MLLVRWWQVGTCLKRSERGSPLEGLIRPSADPVEPEEDERGTMVGLAGMLTADRLAGPGHVELSISVATGCRA
nr:hypothetical protein BaRGS_027871 [Batillaria attramentaria]